MNGSFLRPRKPPDLGLLALTLAGLCGLAWIEWHPKPAPQPHFEEKRAAAENASRGFAALHDARLRLGPLQPVSFDPARTGLVGEPMTTVTSYPGSLVAKQTSLNPNFAAVVVGWLRCAGVHHGDCVAVGLSGSFPSINLCTLCALETIGAEALVVSSLGASQWGANRPDWLWLDQEAALRAAGVFRTRSAAATLGGVQDMGFGLSDEGRLLLRLGAQRHGVPLLDSSTFEIGIDERMALYDKLAGGRRIAAYVNVGGNTLSVGTDEGKTQFPPGLSRGVPSGAKAYDSVMLRFAQRGAPVIHCVQIRDLARRYGFPEAPTEVPPVGQGKVFVRLERDRTLSGLLAVGLGLCLWRMRRRAADEAASCEDPEFPSPADLSTPYSSAALTHPRPHFAPAPASIDAPPARDG